MNILIMGPAGAGKGTMSALIKDAYNIPHISTGDMLREHIRKGTSLGLQAKEFMDGGHLVPDAIINAMVEERLKEEDCASGYLLDGFPRTLVQAEDLEEIGKRTGRSVQVVIVLEVAQSVLEERITGRRICPNCGAIYHIHNHPTKVDGICDVCGSPTVQRKDDTVEKLQARMEEYRQLTEPVIEYYKQKNLVCEIDAAKSTKDAFADIKKVLG